MSYLLASAGQLLSLIYIVGSFQVQNQCVLKDGHCTYHVHLDNACVKPGSREIHNEIQNDKTQKVSQIQQNLVDVKSEHDRRIKELENKISMLVEGAHDKPASEGSRPTMHSRFGHQQDKFAHVPIKKRMPSPIASPLSGGFGLTSGSTDQNEKQLLDILQSQFNDLRNRLRSTKHQLRTRDLKLNTTLSRLNSTEAKLLDMTTKFLETEAKLFEMQISNTDLNNALEDRENELNKTQRQLDETINQLRKVEMQFNVASSKLSRAQKEVDLHKKLLKSARQHLQRALIKYHDLNVENENTKRALRVRETELIVCYRGKTSQFCSFEDENICGFEQENGTDFFNWSRGKGETPSTGTGPPSDHTCASPDHGYYMYVEASRKGRGQNARIMSPRYRSYGEQCVEFYYHMFGSHIGTLNVYMKVPDQEVAPVWRAFGEQGYVWSMARLPVPQEEASKSYQVVFEAIVDAGYAGDIAIDDFRVFDGPCYDVTTENPDITKSSSSTPATLTTDVSNTISTT